MRAQSKWRGLRAASIAVFAAAAFVMSLLVPSVGDTPARASLSAGFDAGNIIDDALFYDGTAWNASQIQTFLNQRVPRCTIGDPGRGAYTPYGSTTIAGACLNGSLWTTAARPANAYCKAMAGATNESAASLIARVSAACGISPKVLLVMLEKEQSLVTDTWPTFRQYDFAMGAYCPDSGPGGSANCDPGRAGFPNQLYNGARLLKIYKAFPNSYNYKPFQSNRIQWHPNAGCGTSDVWIENWATAALYIYTPYRPNQAALNAGWGTGDACSSYGNRNFYNFYTTWFGSVRAAAQLHPAFVDHWNRNGGASGRYGIPTASAVDHGGVITQQFASGMMYSNSWLGVTAVNGAISTRYRQLDTVKGLGPWGALGYPVGAETSANGGVRQRFENGEIYWTQQYGAQMVNGGILSYYLSTGGSGGSLGLPIGRMASLTANGGGWSQDFTGGTLYYSRDGQGFVVHGGIRAEYNRLGGASGRLGFPTSRMYSVSANGGGWYQSFAGGTLFIRKSDAKPIRFGSGPFLTRYLAEGGPASSWGWPLAEATCGLASGGCRIPLQTGVLSYAGAGDVWFVPNTISEFWQARAGESGVLGYPVGAAVSVGSGVFQEFQFGSVMLGTTGRFYLTAEHTRAVKAAGGASSIGMIMGAAQKMDAERYFVPFERAELYVVMGQNPVRFGNGPFLDTYRNQGRGSGSWGWPLAGAVCGLPGGACTMEFANGTAQYTPERGVWFVPRGGGARSLGIQQPETDQDAASGQVQPSPDETPSEEGSAPPADGSGQTGTGGAVADPDTSAPASNE